jgi:hypothetical protein
VPRRVIIGLSDGKNVEITKGDLHPGDPVVISQRLGVEARSTDRQAQ